MFIVYDIGRGAQANPIQQTTDDKPTLVYR